MKNYVAEGGWFRHIFQGYFQSNDALQTSNYNSRTWTLNSVETVVEHLKSPASWHEFRSTFAEDECLVRASYTPQLRLWYWQ